MLHPRHLMTFLVTVETGSMTATAHRLHYAQPTVSLHIQVLERELGCQLLHRERPRLRVTDAGARLVGTARQVLALLDEAHLVAATATSSAPPRSPLVA